ncbi:MAG: sigma-70 family RNA polymerase sigma factor [Planctomycetota bacterium]|nr:MAG: sigma-70 family RNA polymerase sigma factor [Planctomycetota bacterium]
MVLSDADRQLLDRCLSGENGAWADFVDRYIALLTHVVVTTAGLKLPSVPPELRDDMVAEILMALVDDDFAILRRFKGHSSLGTYLVVVARRIAARRLTRLSSQPHIPLTSPAPAAVEASADADHQALESEEEVSALLSQLPDEEATAIRMFHLEHRSYEDIGTHMGIPQNSVGPLLSRARQRMRKLKQD